MLTVFSTLPIAAMRTGCSALGPTTEVPIPSSPPRMRGVVDWAGEDALEGGVVRERISWPLLAAIAAGAKAAGAQSAARTASRHSEGRAAMARPSAAVASRLDIAKRVGIDQLPQPPTGHPPSPSFSQGKVRVPPLLSMANQPEVPSTLTR